MIQVFKVIAADNNLVTMENEVNNLIILSESDHRYSDQRTQKEIATYELSSDDDYRCESKREQVESRKVPEMDLTYENHLAQMELKSIDVTESELLKMDIKSYDVPDYRCLISEDQVVTVSCKACGNTFADENQLRLHMKIRYMCTDCKKYFTTEIAYKEHAFVHRCSPIHAPIKLYTCNNLNKFIPKLIDPPETVYTCSSCGECLKDEAELNLHLKLFYKCTVCDEKFVTEGAINKHVLVHGDILRGKDAFEVAYICPNKLGEYGLCYERKSHGASSNMCEMLKSRDLRNKSDARREGKKSENILEQIIDTQTVLDEIIIVSDDVQQEIDVQSQELSDHCVSQEVIKDKSSCHACGNYFTDEELGSHLKIRYMCVVCKSHFTTKMAFSAHSDSQIHNRVPKVLYTCDDIKQSMTKQALPRQGPYKCIKCSEHFESEERLQQHMQIRVNKHIACEKSLTAQDAFDEHGIKISHVCDVPKVKRVYAAENSYRCTKCSRSFPDETTLNSHLKIRYKCLVCDVDFEAVSIFTEHMLTHNDNSTFKVIHACDDEPCATSQLYHCLICGKRFKNGFTLALHMAEHTGAKPFKCNVCQRRFREKVQLARHLQTHSEVKPYKCADCGKRFHSKKNIQSHRKVHEKPYNCYICSRGFNHIRFYELHVLTHAGGKPYKCEECAKCFAKKFLLNLHVKRKHTGEKRFQCSVCGKCFYGKKELDMHMRIHNNERPYQCFICGKCFTQDSTFRLHMRTHTGEKPHECAECGKRFTRKNQLNIHMRIHTGERPYECSVCSKCFISSCNLMRHVRIHTGEKPYTCEVCGRSFNQNSVLVAHRKMHKRPTSAGSEERPHQCKECGKTFKHICNLNCHMKYHTSKGPYDCNDCGKVFRHVSMLCGHMMTHTGSKPHTCKFCGKCFAQIAGLNMHKRIHTGEKPYQCEICFKRFVQKPHLVSHMRIHTGETPYKCGVCGRCFSQKRNRDFHIQTHTDEKPHKCDECGKCFRLKRYLQLHARIHTGRTNDNKLSNL